MSQKPRIKMVRGMWRCALDFNRLGGSCDPAAYQDFTPAGAFMGWLHAHADLCKRFMVPL